MKATRRTIPAEPIMLNEEQAVDLLTYVKGHGTYPIGCPENCGPAFLINELKKRGYAIEP